MSDTTHNPSGRAISGQSVANGRFYLYVGCGWACLSYRPHSFTQSFTIVAPDQRSATDAALDLLRKNAPPSDGWQQHSVHMNMIERSTIEQWLRDTAPPEGT